MATQYIADCSKMPSESNCDLKISGSDRQAVAEAAYQHAVGSIHRHSADEAGLRESITDSLEVIES